MGSDPQELARIPDPAAAYERIVEIARLADEAGYETSGRSPPRRDARFPRPTRLRILPCLVHSVVVLALPAVEAFDLAIPAQVFGGRRVPFPAASPPGPGWPRCAGSSPSGSTGLVTIVADAKSKK
jgi:hypothetical protein